MPIENNFVQFLILYIFRTGRCGEVHTFKSEQIWLTECNKGMRNKKQSINCAVLSNNFFTDMLIRENGGILETRMDLRQAKTAGFSGY